MVESRCVNGAADASRSSAGTRCTRPAAADFDYCVACGLSLGGLWWQTPGGDRDAMSRERAADVAAARKADRPSKKATKKATR